MLLLATAILVLLPRAAAWIPTSSHRLHAAGSLSASRSRLALTQSTYGRLGLTNTLDMEASSSTSSSLASLGFPVNGGNNKDEAIVEIENEQHHQAFLQTHKDKLVVMKVRYFLKRVDKSARETL